MPDSIIRIAICQLSCHPVLSIGDRNFLREPFVPSSDDSLSKLGRASLDLGGLQDDCERQYLEWHEQRLDFILQYFAGQERVPDIIVFPEASVPLSFLKQLADHAKEKRNCVIAGTHSLKLSKTTAQLYKELNINRQELKKWGEITRSCTAILPVLTPSNSHFRRKAVPSVFEITDIASSDTKQYQVEPVNLPLSGNDTSVLILVCAEALQKYNAPGGYELVVIPAYNPKGTDVFRPCVEHHIANQLPVVICNDGAFGGSGVHAAIDNRMELWWWEDPYYGRLPKGDAIVVVDLDKRYLATQVGVTNPRPPFSLVKLASVTYEDARDDAYDLSNRLRDISSRDDPDIQQALLSDLSTLDRNPLQEFRRAHLERLCNTGSINRYYWDALADDCQIPAISDLKGLEANLAADCSDRLFGILRNPPTKDTLLLGRIAAYAALCQSRSQKLTHTTNSPLSGEQTLGMLDREDEVFHVKSFLTDPQQTLIHVIGLQAVGKSAVITAARNQTGHNRAHVIPLTQDVTPEYVASAVLLALGVPFDTATDSPILVLREIDARRIPRGSVFLFEEAQNLATRLIWRDPAFPEVFELLLDYAEQQNSKVILESTVRLDLATTDPNRTKRIWIKGLDAEFGSQLLDQQLRRSGLDPDLFSQENRRTIAGCLDGHPGALILASEHIEHQGIEQVIRDVQKKRGVHSRIVERFIRGLQITDEEQDVLSLLNNARSFIPVSMISHAIERDTSRAVYNLWRMALLIRGKDDTVSLTGLLRGFASFSPPNPDVLTRFHVAAANYFINTLNVEDTEAQLRAAIEARYHAFAAGHSELAPDLGSLADGALGAAMNLVSENRYERARPILDRLLQTSRDKPEVLELAAVTYARLGLCEEALALAKEAISLQPSRVWVLTEVGRLALYVHRDEITENALEIAKATGQDNTFIATLEGKIWLRREMTEEAIASFQRGVQMAEHDAWPHFYLGRTYNEMGRFKDAIAVLQDGEEMESQRWHPRRRVLAAIRTQLALAYMYDDDMENAERWLGIVAEEDADNPEVARAFAYLKIKQGNEKLASRALSNLQPGKANNRHQRAQIHLFRALFYHSAGLKEKASEEFNQASLADPRNVFVLLRWAETLVEMAHEADAESKPEAARVCAERAQDVAGSVLKFDRDNADALRLLEQLSDDFNVQ